MTQKFDRASPPIFYVLNNSEKEISSPRRASRPFTFRVRLKQRQSLLALCLACSQLCIYAAVCVWCDQYSQNKEARHREGLELSADDLTTLTHLKKLNCFGRPNARLQTQQTFLLTCHKRQVFQQKLEKGHCFVTQLSISYSERFNTTSQQSKFRHGMCFEGQCVAVLGAKTPNSAGLHSIEVLMPAKKQNIPNCSWVLISSGFNQHASQMLDCVHRNPLPHALFFSVFAFRHILIQCSHF